MGHGAHRPPGSRRGRGAHLTRLLFDTTFLIDAERSGDDLDDVIADDDDVAMAAITVAELRVGVELARGRRQEGRRAFLDDIVLHVPVLGHDLDVAEAHAHLLIAVRQQGAPRGAHDLIIAATARASGRMVVTADSRAFRNLPGVDVRGPGDGGT
ncbi:MAG: PIN domain-containing protein [Acidimicrobiia bacterium]